MNKLELKKEMLNKRRSLSKDDVQNFGNIIFNKVINTLKVINSDVILCYVSFDNEVDTYKLINYFLSTNKKVGIPKVENNNIIFYYIDNLESLLPGKYGIMEPSAKTQVNIDDIKKALLIVPGTSFSFEGNRNGYGKGYYDRFIKKYRPKCLIGLAYEFQVLESIYSEDYDQKLDIVITEENIYNTKKEE